MSDQIMARYERRTKIYAALLLVIGSAQMLGDLTGQVWLKALAAVTMASPCPKVFTSHKGLETYSTRFFLEWLDKQGETHSLELTPEVYSNVAGPYQRRNIYGAVLALGPVMVGDRYMLPMFESVSRYALAGNAPLLRELGIDPATIEGNVKVRYEAVGGTGLNGLPEILEVR